MKRISKKMPLRKGQLRMLLMLLFSLLVIIGGWFFTKRILTYQEARLLARSGRLHMADSGYSLQQDNGSEDDSAKEDGAKERKEKEDGSIEGGPKNIGRGEATQSQTDGQAAFHGEPLPEDQMAQALAVWEAGGFQMSHEPKAGQMDMEQAIAAANTWIHELSAKEFLPSGLAENRFQQISAILYTPDSKSSLPDYLISWWQIIYLKNDIQITLTIHAASGQIWKAEIFMDEANVPSQIYAEDLLLEAAFPFLEADNQTEEFQMQSSLHKTYRFLSGWKVYADVNWGMICVDGLQERVQLVLSLHSLETMAK